MVLRMNGSFFSGTQECVELGLQAGCGLGGGGQVAGDVTGAGGDLGREGLFNGLDHPADGPQVADKDDEEGKDGRGGERRQQLGHGRSSRMRCVARSSCGAAVTVWTKTPTADDHTAATSRPRT